MNVLDGTEAVLKEARQPLHYAEITRRLLETGLWQTTGKTPEATVRGALGTDIAKRGLNSRFQRTNKGMFALRAWGLPQPESKTPSKTETDARSPRKRLSFNDATEQVLEKFSDKKPMHYRDVTDKALALGLIQTTGKTPAATLYAQVIQEIQRRTRQGERPRFVQHGKGYIGLSKWMSTGLAFQIDQHNEQVRKQLLEGLGKMAPADFESLIGALLAKLGFEDVEVTEQGGDGGIDVRGTLVIGDVIGTRMAVQVKRWKRNVQTPIVQQVRGSLGTHEQGLIITTSDFSKGARAEAERPNATPVALMNGEQLVKLMVENDIGIQRKAYDLIALVEPVEG